MDPGWGARRISYWGQAPRPAPLPLAPALLAICSQRSPKIIGDRIVTFGAS